MRRVQTVIVAVLAVSLLSVGAMAAPSLSPSQDQNELLTSSNQSQTAYFGSGITITIHTEIGRDATIQSYEIQMNMSQMLFARYRSRVKSSGYATIEDRFVATWTEGGTESFEYEYKKVRRGNLVTVTFSFQNHAPPENVGVLIKKLNGTASFMDRRFLSSASASVSSEWAGFSLNYYLTMPGEITATNANSTSGNTAEWHLTGGEIGQTPIIAESKIPEKSGVSGLLVSGALIVGGVVVLVGVVVGFRRRDRL